MKGFKDTAEMRTDELMRAAKILGLKEVFFLGYRDSGMPGSEDNKHPKRASRAFDRRSSGTRCEIHPRA
jgi:LmbE family N-acetylglucosaminyl deacetylase